MFTLVNMSVGFETSKSASWSWYK